MRDKRPAYGFRSAAAAEFPEMVVCGMCFVCNARCVHCPNAATDFTASLSGDDRFMSWEILRRVADECGAHPHSLVRVSSAGEVLMHPDATAMIEYILRVNRARNVALTTNGAMLTRARSESFLANGIRSIEFSLDGHTKELFEAIRVGLDFHAVQRNLDDLLELRTLGGHKTRIIASVIAQPLNWNKVDEIKKYWLDRGVDDVLVRPLLSFKGVIPRTDEQVINQIGEGVPCPFLWERVLVDSVGGVRGCVSDIFNHALLGNVMKNSIGQLWHGPEIEEWRELHLGGKWKEASACGECVDIQTRSWDYNYFYALDKESGSKDD